MERIYSRLDPAVLLHVVHRLADVRGRTNIVPETEYLQAASMRLTEGQTFKAHRHVEGDRTTKIPQESWLVISGRVKCLLYDLDDTIIAEPVLDPGDCSVTLRGGHNYVAMKDDTIVYEYKTGPYLGVELDKTFI